MIGMNNVYAQRERNYRGAQERRVQEQVHAWSTILGHYLAELLEKNHANPPSYYVWVETDGELEVAWPLCSNGERTTLCLFPDGNLAWVDGYLNGSQGRPAKLIDFCLLEDMSSSALSEVFDGIGVRGGVFPSRYASYREMHWDDPDHIHARASSPLPGK
ncbi:MAG: hypothetical protein WAZ21_03480 [Candidatus Saccharimonadales bacterium]